MEKKSSAIFFCMIILLAISIVSAQNNLKIEIIKSPAEFNSGEDIAFKISLYDSQNNLVNSDISVKFENEAKTKSIEQKVLSQKLETINLGANALSGLWTITANYKNPETQETAEASSSFVIKEKKLARFELNNDILTIENAGNTRYAETLQIIIGKTTGRKSVDLAVGEKTSFRLIAPDGSYDVKITDGTTTIAKENVALSGNVIGILDEKITDNPLTSGIKTGEESFYSSIRNSSFTYIFIIAVIGALILLAIERKYRKKISRN